MLKFLPNSSSFFLDLLANAINYALFDVLKAFANSYAMFPKPIIPQLTISFICY